MTNDNDAIFIDRLFYFTETDTEEIDNPSLSQITNAINLLDGVSIDTVSIGLSNGNSMDIGGGKDNQYICYIRTSSTLYNLIDPAISVDSNNVVMIMMNEEANSFPQCCVVNQEMVITAVHYFTRTGECHPDLHWDNALDFEPL